MLLSAKKIKSDNNTRIIWLHGWGQDHKSFLSMACLFNDCENIMIDMAGFGTAKKPKEAWGTNDYALDLAQYLKKEKISKKTYLIGHSFGCRVALRFAALFPNRVDGIVLIAAAGLKKKRSIFFKMKAAILKLIARFIGKIDFLIKTNLKEKYSNKFGSPDYRNAKGIMRQIFVKTISEDLSEIASDIKTNTILIFGKNDKDTPPEFGKRYNNLLTNSQYFELPNFDHYSLLSQGKYQVQNIISNFIKN